MKLTFCGDIHGAFRALDLLNDKEKPDIIIQCGDFGIWTDNNHKVRTQCKTPIYFCRGNHENHDLLDKAFGDKDIHKIERSNYFNRAEGNVHLCNHGSVLSVNNRHDDERKIMFIGGAMSIDKHRRTEGKTWWPQELLSKAQEDYVLEQVELHKPDIIVSHTCPSDMIEYIDLDGDKLHDPVARLLDAVHDLHKPNLWVHGHFHRGYQKDIYVIDVQGKNLTKFVGLGMCDIRTGTFKEDFYYSLVI